MLDSARESTGFRARARVSCEYLGEWDRRTGVITRKQRKQTVPRRAQVAFLFKAELWGSSSFFVAHTRQDHAIARGAPFPKSWVTALSASCLPSKIGAVVEEMNFDNIVKSDKDRES